MTKKELLEAIKDMPDDAEVYVRDSDYEECWDVSLEHIVCKEDDNDIIIW